MVDYQHQYDLCIVGGGINGAGIARDAAGRGLKVLLLEQGDFAGSTSSASSKMIHGGLRYLEFFDFGLVRKSLAEREVLLKIAPEIVRPMQFCIPHKNSVRPAWMVWLGLFLYDHLWPRQTLPASSRMRLRRHPFGEGMKKSIATGFSYSDCWVDDARLVILNLRDAAERGAEVRNYCFCRSVERKSCLWEVSFCDHLSGRDHKIAARAVINATGPYAYEFLKNTGHVLGNTPTLRLVQGTHIVVPKLYDGNHACLLQLADKRVVFVFPYGDYSLCGTTETDFRGDPVEASATTSEKKYLCAALNEYFVKQTIPSDIVWSYSGVRPLFQDFETDVRKLSRDYRLYEDRVDGLPLLTIFGGKITTYRTLAEEVMTLLRRDFPQMGGAWTCEAVLPHCPVDLSGDPSDDDLDYFIQTEWARRADDLLWRRTKWGLHLAPEKVSDLRCRFEERVAEICSDKPGS